MVNGLNEITLTEHKTPWTAFDVVEAEVFTHVSIHVRLLRGIMSKNCH